MRAITTGPGIQSFAFCRNTKRIGPHGGELGSGVRGRTIKSRIGNINVQVIKNALSPHLKPDYEVREPKGCQRCVLLRYSLVMGGGETEGRCGGASPRGVGLRRIGSARHLLT